MYRPSNNIESLESRLVFSGPAASEQLMIELINRARANPTAEASRDGVALNEGLTAGTISTAAKQPLAPNSDLDVAAEGHSQYMLDNDVFAHDENDGSDPGDRMANAGYVFAGSSGWAENIAWTGSTGATPAFSAAVPQLHKSLFVDSGIAGRGHRTNLMDPDMKEIGSGVLTGNFQIYNAVMVTTDFAFTNSDSFLTGVAYSDAVTHDNFYTIGEGLGGVTVRAVDTSSQQVFTTTTYAAGGYSLELAPGTYTVTASGGGLSGTVNKGNITIANQNIKADFTTADAQDTAAPTATLAAVPKWTATGDSAIPLTITFRDATGVKFSTLDNDDLTIIGPFGAITASLFKTTPSQNGSAIVATYLVSGPGGGWNFADNGTYTVKLVTGQVTDTLNNAVGNTTVGTFTVAVPASTVQLFGGGDFDGDNKEDIIVRDTGSGENAVWLMNGGVPTGAVALGTTANLNQRIVGIGDFNNDGNPDIMWRNTATGVNGYWRMNGTNSTGYISLPTVANQAWQPAGVADFDGDGDADILWHNSTTGGNLIWTLQNGVVQSIATLPVLAGRQWYVGAVGDFDGDGDPDIMWRNSATGANTLWTMNGTTRVSATAFLAVTNLNYQLEAASDLDNNGTSDLLWRNTATGINVAWFLNHGAVQSTLPLNFAT